MALATKSKPTAHHRKRQAQHHRQNKPYLRTYWPYLPMLAIVGLGAVINSLWSHGSAVDTAGLFEFNGQLTTGSVTRLQSLTGNQSAWLWVGVLLITALAFALFVVRHWYRVHRLLNKGEAFVYKHPWFDIAIVLVFTIGFILTRTT